MYSYILIQNSKFGPGPGPSSKPSRMEVNFHTWKDIIDIRLKDTGLKTVHEVAPCTGE